MSEEQKRSEEYAEGRAYVERFAELSEEEKTNLKKIIGNANMCDEGNACGLFDFTEEQLRGTYEFLAYVKEKLPQEFLTPSKPRKPKTKRRWFSLARRPEA